jgi:hypothetical protein
MIVCPTPRLSPCPRAGNRVYNRPSETRAPVEGRPTRWTTPRPAMALGARMEADPGPIGVRCNTLEREGRTPHPPSPRKKPALSIPDPAPGAASRQSARVGCPGEGWPGPLNIRSGASPPLRVGPTAGRRTLPPCSTPWCSWVPAPRRPPACRTRLAERAALLHRLGELETAQADAHREAEARSAETRRQAAAAMPADSVTLFRGVGLRAVFPISLYAAGPTIGRRVRQGRFRVWHRHQSGSVRHGTGRGQRRLRSRGESS